MKTVVQDCEVHYSWRQTQPSKLHVHYLAVKNLTDGQHAVWTDFVKSISLLCSL